MGARLVEFAGWLMPVQFSSVLREHHAVRRAAGLFDVSHMGEIEVSGSDAMATLQRLTCNDAARLRPGQAQYSALTNPAGGFIDDILVYRLDADRFLLVVNAANTDKDFAWIRRHASGRVEVSDVSSRWAQIAVQGPEAPALLADRASIDPESIPRFAFARATLCGARALLSRTGYTGEDGFEIYLDPRDAAGLFRALLEAGRERGVLPCGLGARDTLRLEAGMRLYGSDIDESTTAIEAGLGWIVKLDKGDFLGRDVLERQSASGPDRVLAGFRMTDRGVPRRGHELTVAGRPAGPVTSGTLGPSVGRGIGFAYVPRTLSGPGTPVEIRIRARAAAAEIVPTPFYRRSR
ncbi:MAG: glycine cleavage system aminomethyltransferase GcvT [Acidobacteriota bacterium]